MTIRRDFFARHQDILEERCRMLRIAHRVASMRSLRETRRFRRQPLQRCPCRRRGRTPQPRIPARSRCRLTEDHPHPASLGSPCRLRPEARSRRQTRKLRRESTGGAPLRGISVHIALAGINRGYQVDWVASFMLPLPRYTDDAGRPSAQTKLRLLSRTASFRSVCRWACLCSGYREFDLRGDSSRNHA